jgi:hypothetical protein
VIRSGFKTFKRVYDQGGREVQTRGILLYFEDSSRAPDAEMELEGKL